MKMIAIRPQDETDIRDLLVAYGNQLDFDFIRAELDTIRGPDDPRGEKLEAWIRQAR